jgi:hypothetical protein
VGILEGILVTDSTYTGVLWRAQFSCPSSAPPDAATITLVAGTTDTNIKSSDSLAHGEEGSEALSVTCGAAVPVATPTVGAPTSTPAPTNLGDVDGDGIIDVEDALWILWAEAGAADAIPRPENADLNHDGVINAVDALYVLWIVGGEV